MDAEAESMFLHPWCQRWRDPPCVDVCERRCQNKRKEGISLRVTFYTSKEQQLKSKQEGCSEPACPSLWTTCNPLWRLRLRESANFFTFSKQSSLYCRATKNTLSCVLRSLSIFYFKERLILQMNSSTNGQSYLPAHPPITKRKMKMSLP